MHHDRGVVDAAVGQRGAHQRLARTPRAEPSAPSASISLKIQSSTMSVSPSQQSRYMSPGSMRDDAVVHLDVLAQADGAHDHVRRWRPEARRQLGVVLVEVDQRVVARHLLELPLRSR